jgi:hypothetical protein
MKTQKGIEIQLYSIFNLGVTCGGKLNAMPRALYLWKREPVPIVRGAGSPPLPVWTGAENLATHIDLILRLFGT